jgi:hypothetical protein
MHSLLRPFQYLSSASEMLKRDTTVRCLCASCKYLGDLGVSGSPLDKLIPASQRLAHQRRMQLEAVESFLGTQKTAIHHAVYSIMRDTLDPNGENLDIQPNQLWTSKHDFQREASSQRSDALSCKDPPVSAILEEIQ